MAVTKTHPIKSTLKAAIDYILNPEKTDGKLLASSFGCGLETADIEFAWTREAAGDRGTHLGRHLIQSFAVGETTPEEAHKIGMELAGAVLGGKYEFVLTTHVDKDHLHNHLIFNSVSFVDYKKYHSNKQSYYHIRRTSDRICKEHGLAVLDDLPFMPPDFAILLVVPIHRILLVAFPSAGRKFYPFPVFVKVINLAALGKWWLLITVYPVFRSTLKTAIFPHFLSWYAWTIRKPFSAVLVLQYALCRFRVCKAAWHKGFCPSICPCWRAFSASFCRGNRDTL